MEASCGPRPNISASTLTNAGAAASPGGWFSAASASGSHSISRSLAVCPFRTSQFSTVSSGEQAIRPVAPRRRRCSVLTGVPSRKTDRRSFQPSASHSMTPPRRCHGAGSGGHESTECLPAVSIVGTLSDGCTRTFDIAPIRRRNANVSR